MTNKIHSFEDLIVWQKAIDLSVDIYRKTEDFPKEEIFGLTSQIRRACNSVSLNISEGSVKTTKGFISQLTTAHGSVSEVLSASILADRLGYLKNNDLTSIRLSIGEITKMLNALISSLERKIN